MTTQNINYFKKKYIKFFWIDYLEFKHSHKLLKFDFIESIDEDNSNFGYTDLEINWTNLHFKYQKVGAKWYKKAYIFDTIVDWHSIPMFILLYWWKNWAMTSNWKVAFYSSFFASINYYFNFTSSEFISKFFYLEPKNLTRLDIACDISLKLPSILKLFNSKTKFHSQLWDDEKYKWFFQTYYTNQIQSDKNRNMQIRLYDKILDSVKKHKWFLFPHLKNNSEIRRLELELRTDTCKRLPYSILDILDNKNDILSKIFWEKVWKFIPLFSELGSVSLLPYENRESSLKFDYLELWHIPDIYMKRVEWYLKSILDNTWQNWFFQLLLWALFDDFSIKEGSDGKTKKFIKTKRDPLILLDDLINYYNKKLNIPLWLIRNTLRKYKKHSSLTASEIQNIFN